MAMNGLYINNMLYPPNNHNINDLLKNISKNLICCQPKKQQKL